MVSPNRSHSSRREAVLDGLVDLFLDQGFSHLGMDAIAAHLRCSKSTLYDIAASKEQLIVAVVRTFFKRATTRVEAEVEAEIDPVTRISVYLEAIARELAPATPAFYADLQDFAPAREIYSANTEIAARRVRLLVRDAADPTHDPDHGLDAGFLGVVAASTMQVIQSGEMEATTGLDDAAAYRLLAELIVRGTRRREGT